MKLHVLVITLHHRPEAPPATTAPNLDVKR
jgi:hypothetical protein